MRKPLGIQQVTQGHNIVADGWAGAVQKLLGIQKCDGRTDLPTNRPTRQGVESRVRDYKKHERRQKQGRIHGYRSRVRVGRGHI